MIGPLLQRMILMLLLFLCSLLIIACDQQEKVQIKEVVAAVPEYEGTVIAVGDSLTAGLGVEENEAYPALLEKKLQENGYNWRVINGGISGETSSGTLARIKWILKQQPDVVILETGANDGLRGIPTSFVRENISKAIQALQEGNVTVVLAGMQMIQNLGANYTKDFAAIYPAIATEQQCIFIPFFLKNIAGEPTRNQDDSIHPNKQGHSILVETVYPYVLEAVRAVKLGKNR